MTSLRPSSAGRRRQAWSRLGLSSIIVAFVFCADFREDELHCEEAISHIADCCPDADLSTVRCSEVHGCDSKDQPVLKLDESKCIQDASCRSIRDSGVCDQLFAALGELGCRP